MKIFITFILFFLTHHLFAQFDGKPYVIHLPINDINSSADTINMDTVQNQEEVEFIFIKPKELSEYNFWVALVEDDTRLTRSWQIIIDSKDKVTIMDSYGLKLAQHPIHSDSLKQTFPLPLLNIGRDKIYIGKFTLEKFYAKKIALISDTYLEHQKQIQNNNYPKSLIFQSQYCENLECQSLKKNLIKSINVLNFIDDSIQWSKKAIDSINIKQLTDTSYYINSNIKTISIFLNPNCFVGNPDNEIRMTKPYFFHQKFKLTHGKIDKITYQALKKNYKGKKFTNDTYQNHPYLVSKKTKWNKHANWLYYTMLWNSEKMNYWFMFE